MASKEQFLGAVRTFIYNDMLPNAKEAGYRIILRGAAAAIDLKPDAIFNKIASNQIVSMLDAVDEYGNVDTELLAKLLPEALGSDTLDIEVKLLSKTPYVIGIGADDVRKAMSYI